MTTLQEPNAAAIFAWDKSSQSTQLDRQLLHDGSRFLSPSDMSVQRLWVNSMSNTPSPNCVFVGGIHGVGKSSLCDECARLLNIAHHTASELIRRHNNRDIGLYKEVVSVSANQDCLVNALHAIAHTGPYLLDGHFSIRSKSTGISIIPSATFEAIAPCGIVIVTGDPDKAAKRMLQRDAMCVSATELRAMQRLEIEQGRLVAQRLKVKIIELHSPSITEFVSSVSAFISP